MATFSYYDVIATSYSCSDHTLPVSSSLTALCPTTCGSVATFTNSSLTTSVCISQATSPDNLMAALPRTLVAATGGDQVPTVGAVVDVLQCSSLPISSHNPMTGPSCKSTSRVCLAKINSSLVCFLCGGYLIDATTINRCLHSFCRACILRHLKLVNFCPVCKALLGGTHPHKSLRPDRTLQRVVYKVVPGLYKNERERRRKFAAVSRKPEIINRSHHQKVRPQSVNLAGPWVYSDDENFSVCLRHQLHLNNASAYWTQFPMTDGDGSNGNTNQLIGCRFVLCPALTSMQLIKKFIKLKLNLKEQSKVFLFCSGEILPDDYTLLDIAYIFSWMKTGPLLIDYVILNTVHYGDDGCRLSSAAAAAAAVAAAAAAGGAAALTEDAQLLPRQNSRYTSTETNSRGPETECLAFGLNQSCLGVLLDPVDQNAHLGMSYETKDLNEDRSKQDLTLTESNISFCSVPKNVPHGFLSSFSEVAQLHSSDDASRPVDLGMKDTKAAQKTSSINCSEDPPMLDYSCEAMMTGGTGECLRPDLSTNQFAETAYQQMSYANDFSHGLAILPEAASVPRLDSSSCGVGGMCSYGEDSSSSTCGIQLIGVLAQSIDGSIIQLPNSCFLYNRPVISSWHPSFHETEMDSWRNSGTNSCFVDRGENDASEGLQFLLPMMHPRPTKAVADEVADMTGVGLPVYQYCSANAECLTNSFGEPLLSYHGRNFQALPTKAVFNVDARTEVTEGEMLEDLDQSCQRSWLGTSQTLPVSRDVKADTGDDRSVHCREKRNELNRETDEKIAVPEQQCVVLSEGLPQPLPLLHTEGERESIQMFKMYDLSAGNVSEDNLVIDRSVAAPTCHVADDVILEDSSCSLSVPSEYRTVSVESHRTFASEYHLPQEAGASHPMQVTSCALLSVQHHSETLEASSSHLTVSSSEFPTIFRCSSPVFKCQVTASDQSIPSSPSPYVEQNSLECNTDTAARCHSYEAGSEADWQTPRTAIQTDAEETSQLSAHDHWDERGRDESLTVTTVSSELTKPMLTDAAEIENGQVEREPPPPVDMVLLAMPPHLSFDSANITDRSLELTTES